MKVQSDSSKGVLGKRPAPSSDRGAILPTVKKLAVAQSIESAPSGVKLVEQSFSQSSGVSYEQRTGSGQLVASFTPRNTPAAAVDPIPSTPSRTSRCAISYDDPDFPNIFLPYRFMYTSIEERAIALERHHLHLQKVMCSAHGIAEDSLQPVGSPSQELVWCCGRICSENPEGRINLESVLLEGSRKESGGRRVSLDLKEVDAHFSVFPGQIVLVQGINSSGRTLVAKRIIDGTDPPKRLDIGSRSGNVHIMMASGPFTTSENLDYQPIRDFLGLALSKNPDVIILCGPFVDVSHPKLNDGSVFMEFDDGTSVPASYETVFIRKIVKECLESFYDDSEGPMPHTQIVLIPSLLDGHHECVYPQPPFGDREAVKTTFIDTDIGSIQFPHSKGREKKVHLLSNPCMFEIDGFVFGAATNDILFSLSCDEASSKLGGNRLPYLASHLIRQNSFAPQFPIPPAVMGQVKLRRSECRVHIPSYLNSTLCEFLNSWIGAKRSIGR